jgi:DNA polymerase III delta prime subunit
MIDLSAFAPQQIFLIQGNKTDFQELVDRYTEKDVLDMVLDVSRFTVENAQELVAFNLEENGTQRWCMVYFPVFSPEAAQALLKTLEEPSNGTHIALVTPYPYLVPLTIRSRVALLTADSASTATSVLTKKEAEDMVKTILADDDIPAPDRRAHAASMLDIFESMAKGNTKKATAIYKAKDLLFKANLPTKQVAEYAISVMW